MELVTCIDCENACYKGGSKGWVCKVHDMSISELIDDGNGGKKSHVTPIECIDFSEIKLDMSEGEGLECCLCGCDFGRENPLLSIVEKPGERLFICNKCETKVTKDSMLNDMDWLEAFNANLVVRKFQEILDERKP